MTSKSRLKDALSNLGLYERIKHSFVYDVYWTLVDRRYVNSKRSEYKFYKELLFGKTEREIIFDIGANQGTKTRTFLDLGARVVAVDPDPANYVVLERCFYRFRMRPKNVVIVRKAVSDSAGHANFWVDEPGGAKNTLNEKWVHVLREDSQRFGERLDFGRQMVVETTTLQDMIGSFGMPIFIKIDVEGQELNVLRGLHQPVPCLSFEVNLPEFLDEAVQSIEYLGTLSGQGTFNYVVDCAQGLVLDTWENAATFGQTIKEIRERSIEVIWRSGLVLERPGGSVE